MRLMPKEMPMGYPTKVQVIQRKASQQWYVNLPAAIAAAMEFAKGEVVEWTIEGRNALRLRRTTPPQGPPAEPGKKKR